MSDLFIIFLPVLIVLAGIGMILGLPVGKWAKAFGMRWLLFAALFAVAPLLLHGVWDYGRNNPPHSFGEILTWLGVFAVALSFFLLLLLGPGSGAARRDSWGRFGSGDFHHDIPILMRGAMAGLMAPKGFPFQTKKRGRVMRWN